MISLFSVGRDYWQPLTSYETIDKYSKTMTQFLLAAVRSTRRGEDECRIPVTEECVGLLGELVTLVDSKSSENMYVLTSVTHNNF